MSRSGISRLLCALLSIAVVSERSTAAENLEAYAATETESARSPTRLLETPLSISVVSRHEFLPSRPALGLDEALDGVPGVFVQQSGNFAQDTRVSIRGYGARAGFGIRGIRLLVDGVPTTLPDGQSEVDSLELAFVDRIEVIRGPSSFLYGGAGGGAVSFSTLSPTETPVLSFRTLFGSHQLSREELIARGSHRGTGYVLGLTTTRSAGYRDHSRAQQHILLTKLERELQDGSLLEAAFSGVWAPEAQDAGGLTRLERDVDRRAARSSSRSFDAGEQLDQQKLALRFRKPLAQNRELRLLGYQLSRDFSSKLPFDKQVAYDRHVWGGSLVYDDQWGPIHWMSGLDLDCQSDLRHNYENQSGTRGAQTLDQAERVRSAGGFLQAGTQFENGLELIGGLRYDWTEFDVRDRFLDDGIDDTDRLRFLELSPRIGMRWGRSQHLQAYANYSSAFQVPTTTELKPSDGSGGFDSGTDPERSNGIEFGIKGLLSQRLVYDIVAFQLRVRNAIIPFSDASGETFYRNAGEIRRRGLEVGLSASLHPGVSVRTVYTYADYRYHDFDRLTLQSGGGQTVDELDGKREPNVPRHLLNAELRIEHPVGLFAVMSLRHFSDIEANDENTSESSGATLSDLRLGYRISARGRSFVPFFGIRNWNGERYDGSLRPNASGARYFEPAPRREFYLGVQLQFGSDDAHP